VQAYIAADERTPDGRATRARILAELDASTEPLSAAEVKTWRKRILDAWAEGPKLEQKKGRHHLWEDEQRGLYIVGGEHKQPKGLFIGMHGGGAGAGDAGEAHGAFDAAVKKRKWLGIYPEVLVKTEHGWTDSGTEEFVLTLVERARRTWDIDPDHVVFGGHSMGGYGSWMLGAHHADQVAALAPSAGAPTPYLGKDGQPNEIVEGVIPNLRNMTMIVYQSDDDPQVPPAANRAAMKQIGEARQRWGGYAVEYWEERGRGHDLPPGGPKALLEKIAGAERDPRPAMVVWQPVLPWTRQSYWLWWDEPVSRALVTATLAPGQNTVRLTCDKPAKGLHVLLDERLLDVGKQVVIELEGEETRRVLPEARLSTLLLSGARGDPELMYAYRVPVAR
jgi:pimeloyl-ACP methyl ester carboxylesterase